MIGVPVPPTDLSFLVLSASGLVKTGKGTCVMVKGTSGSLTVTMYDNTSAAGTKIIDSLVIDAKEEHDIPASFNTGLYFSISGTGKLTVFFL